VPTGIATDDTTKHFFADVIDRRMLASLLGFYDRKKIRRSSRLLTSTRSACSRSLGRHILSRNRSSCSWRGKSKISTILNGGSR
jgi:hypothetical protein